MRVLLVEDDTDTSKLISLSLASSGGIVCDCLKYGKKAIEFATKYDYDMILLDLTLPDINGYEVLVKLRAAKIKTPVMIISATSSLAQKTRCLDDGADDYLTKPFDYGELISRIKAVSRRSRGKANSVVKIDELVINFDERLVTVKDQHIDLTNTEYSILELLASNKGTILTKETFINHLYHGECERQPKIIDVFICKIREKLLKASGEKEYISTIWGRGYILQDKAA